MSLRSSLWYRCIDGYQFGDVLHESAYRLTQRASRVADGQPVIVRLLHPDGVTADERERWQREYDCHLAVNDTSRDPESARASALGVLSYEQPDGGLMMVFEDGAVSLAQRLKTEPFPLRRSVVLALQLATLLDQVHRRKIIHQSLNPSNILCDDKDVLRLTGFGNAVTMPQSASRATSLVPRTALAYISPEQSGRMDRVVDHRSDLYSFGVTFYELLTGAPPFRGDDPLQLVHAHVALSPEPPQTRNPEVPASVSEIALRLLAKNAEDRYQSALGLHADLARCLEELDAGRPLDPFPLGTSDVIDELRIPQRLYGRGRETRLLLDAFVRVGRGRAELLLLAGYTGVGKTALVHDVRLPVVQRLGLFAEGKCDQYLRSVPYAAWIEALSSLVERLLMEDAQTLASWRERILEALGDAAKVLADVVPNLELVIGEQPVAAAVGGIVAQQRLSYLFRRLIRVLARPDHPLVIYLDDLQWIDAASLNLLHALLTDNEPIPLLLIGAYRDNEVDAAHPLQIELANLKRNGARLEHLQLGNLHEDDIAALVADTLRRPAAECRELSQLIYTRTAGNAFFTHQLLRSLAERELLTRDAAGRRWVWDLTKFEGVSITDNVVELLLRKIRKLPDSSQHILTLAACIGHAFDLQTLVSIAGQPRDTVLAELRVLVHEHFLLRIDETLHFAHDHIQQAAHSALDEQTRGRLHLHIAQGLQAAQPSLAPEELFAVAEHYIAGLGQTQEAERHHLVALLVRAGREALRATAYQSALRYARIAQDIAADEMQRETKLHFAIIALTHVALYSLGQLEEADRMFDALEALPVDTLQLTDAVCVQAISLSNRMRFREGTELGLRFLRRLGHPIDVSDIDATLERELARFYAHIDSGVLDRLLELPDMSDPVLLASSRTVSRLIAAAFFYEPRHGFAFMLADLNASFEHGWSETALTSASDVIIPLISCRGDYATGYQLAERIFRVYERYPQSSHLGRWHHSFGMFTCHWYQPVEADIPFAREAYARELASGDLEFACYEFFTTQAAILESASSLDELERETATALAFARQHKNGHGEATYLSYQQLVRALRGRTARPGSFDDDDFNETQHLAATVDNGMARVYYLIHRALAAALTGDDPRCLDLATQAMPLLPNIAGFFPVALATFLHAFGICRRLQAPDLHAEEREELIPELVADQRWLEQRAQGAPWNFQHLSLLVEAERQMDDLSVAAPAYDACIALAEKHGRPWPLALACESAARCYRRHGVRVAAAAYEERALSAYRAWGATVKVSSVGVAPAAVDSSLPIVPEELDMDAVVRASQALTEALSLDVLLPKVMQILVASAGADYACLLRGHEGELRIVVTGRAVRDQIEVEMVQPAAPPSAEALPLHAVSLAARIGSELSLDDPGRNPKFSADPYLSAHQPRSVLCIPISRGASSIGLLYLENRRVARAFTEQHRRALKVLVAQVGISLENARYVDELRLLNQSLADEVAERTRAQEHLAFKNALLASQQEATIDGILVVDVDGKMALHNRRFVEMWGISQAVIERGNDEEALQFVLDQVADPEEFYKGAQRLYASPDAACTDLVVRRDGRTFERYSAPMTGDDGRYFGRAWYFRDITERLSAERAVQESEQRFRALVEQAPLAIAITRDARIVYVNSAFLRLFGVDDPASLTHRPLAKLVAPAKRQALLTHLHECASNLVSLPAFESVGLNGAGDPFPLLGRVAAVQLADGPAVISFFLDLTERAQLEQQLRQAQKMEAIGQLAGGVAHDFNNILSAIMGYSELLRLSLPHHAPAGASPKVAIEGLLDAAERGASLTRRLLTLSRKQAIKLEAVDPDQLVERAEAFLRRVIGEDVDLRIVPRPTLPVLADSYQLEQVLMNLVVNARDAMPTGGELSIETGIVEILDTGEDAELPPGRYASIRVRDTGSGMELETQRRVFEPFFTTKEVGRGTGLGLAIVYGIIEQHRGAVRIESAPGHGTTFEILLPELGEVAAAPFDDQSISEAVGGPETLLLAEDDEAVREIFARFLRSAGYSVIVARNGEEALAKFEEVPSRIALCVLDVVMPRRSGREVHDEIRRREPEAKVLFVSGYSGDRLRREQLPEGSTCLSKPVSMHALLTQVRRMLDEGATTAHRHLRR